MKDFDDEYESHKSLHDEPDVEFLIAGTLITSAHLVDPDAAAESARIDPFLDHAVFEAHPELTHFERPASELEKRAYGLTGSSTAFTVVTKFENGWQNRSVRDFLDKGKKAQTNT